MRSRRRALGQNFLRNTAAADRIMDLFDPRPAEPVLEVGPGEGVLTQRLLQREAVVIAVERDPRLAGILQERYAEEERFHLHAGDARRIPLERILAPHLAGGRRARVLSNLPYSAGTEILMRLLGCSACLASMMVMLQKEVADRICSPPGSRVYGSLSVLTQYFTTPKQLMTLEPGSFFPPPRVRSAVISMPFRPDRELTGEEEEAYAPFIRSAFLSRRRTLPNNMAPVWGCDSREAARRVEAAGIQPSSRPEALDRESFIRLYRAGVAGL
jgi:16S rRNA (adenine1518-N6/adenine1519-N6)-dimethyltransferase